MTTTPISHVVFPDTDRAMTYLANLGPEIMGNTGQPVILDDERVGFTKAQIDRLATPPDDAYTHPNDWAPRTTDGTMIRISGHSLTLMPPYGNSTQGLVSWEVIPIDSADALPTDEQTALRTRWAATDNSPRPGNAGT